MDRLTIFKSKATVVVGVDFGTTFSGFAFALTSEPDEIYKFYEWPDLREAGGGHYCKTQTSLLYETERSSENYRLLDWGYSAIVKHGRREMSSEQQHEYVKHYLTLFKLHLKPDGEATSAEKLPEGLTPRRVISDYLRKLSKFIINVLHGKLGEHITMEDVQWCLTVPAIWDDRAKQEMKICASMAGMAKGPECPRDSLDSASPHPVMIVLEPEAASLYCQRKVNVPLNPGDQFLIVDVGGGTVDLVLHEKVGEGSGLKVREVSPSTGGLLGGSFVDQAFFEFLSRKISCFRKFAKSQTDSMLKLKGWWETIKYGFDGNSHFSQELDLPARLARAWEEDELSKNLSSDSYDVIELSTDDMLRLFDPVVNGILKLIESKLREGVNVKAMMIVGGFSGSPYLVKRIKEEFSDSERVETNIVVPDEPGAAICCGAVTFGIYGADAIMSRMSKKTYGIDIVRPFCSSDPGHLMIQDDYGESYCDGVFSVYTTRNEEVALDHSVSHLIYPFRRRQTKMSITLFSTDDWNPKYVSDPGVTKEGNFCFTIPTESELGKKPEILVSMYFGRTMVEVEAQGQNFGGGEKFKMPPVRFKRTLA